MSRRKDFLLHLCKVGITIGTIPVPRIAIVVNQFPALSETFIFRKILWLADAGNEITVIFSQIGDWQAFQDKLPLPDEIRLLQVPVFKGWGLAYLAGLLHCVVRHPWRTMTYAWRFLFEHPNLQGIKDLALNLPVLICDSDIIHFEYLGLAATYYQTVLKTPSATVLSCRGADLHLLDQLEEPKRCRYITCLQQIDAVHCVAQELADEVRRISGRSDGIFVNRPAVMVEEIQAKTTYEDQQCPLIISTGRLVWKKGFDYLLAACVELSSSAVCFRVRVLGGGVLESALRRSVKKLGLDGIVEFVGAVSPASVIEELHAADIYVLSSHEEGISNAVLEAMAVGLPIVTTNAGGMAEAVHSGIEGYVTPVRQPSILAARLVELIQDSTLRETMGKAARQRIEREFSSTRQAQLYEQMYRKVLANKTSNEG